jgi:hypothetical protein
VRRLWQSTPDEAPKRASVDREKISGSAFPGMCEDYDAGMPMREMSGRHLAVRKRNGFAQWQILGAHGRVPNRRTHGNASWVTQLRFLKLYGKHWQEHHQDEDVPGWISDGLQAA